MHHSFSLKLELKLLNEICSNTKTIKNNNTVKIFIKLYTSYFGMHQCVI